MLLWCAPPFCLSKLAIALLSPLSPKARPHENGLFFLMLEDAEDLAVRELGLFWRRWGYDLDVLWGVLRLLWVDVSEEMTQGRIK